MRDEIARQAKFEELLRAARDGASQVGGTARIDAAAVLAGFVELTAPEVEDDDGFLEIDERAGLVVVDIGSERAFGISRKPGNLLLDWKKLTEVVPDVAIAAAATLSGPPWLAFMVALYVWNRVWRGAAEALGENEASVMYALWKYRGADNRIAEDVGYARANAARQGFGIAPMTRSAYARAIDALLRLECVTIVGGVIELRESVRISYS